MTYITKGKAAVATFGIGAIVSVFLLSFAGAPLEFSLPVSVFAGGMLALRKSASVQNEINKSGGY
jgi:hypothetical protein